MIRRTLRYSVVALVLAAALLLQPLCPALTLIAQAPVLPSQADRPMAQTATACAQVYLPRLANTSAESASVWPAPSLTSLAQASSALRLFHPDFVITAPGEGWSISGMTFFAVQPVGVDSVTSVNFKAGSTDLGTDNDAADGFRVFL